MKISVCICTWNRADLLDQTLEQMRNLNVPNEIDWEILVVNNNCTDNTDDVLAKHADSLPIRRIFESKPGLSNARNAAIDAAKGELLIWTDDDVLVDPDWLVEYQDAAEKHPDASFFGGPIEPWFEGSPPAWLARSLHKVDIAFAIRDLGSEEFEFSNGQTPFGANFGIRAKVQREFLYDSKLGRKGNSMVSGEETTLIAAMMKDGHSGRWLPEAKVKHFIPKDRQSIAYLRRYYAGHGVLLGRKHGSDSPKLFGRPRWLWRAWIQAELKYRTGRLTKKPEDWIEDLKLAATWSGSLRGKT